MNRNRRGTPAPRKAKWLLVISILGAAAVGGAVLATPDVAATSPAVTQARHDHAGHDHAGPGLSGKDRVQLAIVRLLTARFHRVENAIEAGYELGYVNGAGNRIITGCIAHPTDGAMGYHYFSKKLIDDLVVDELKPEGLVYAPGANGRLRLAAVEYVVPGANSNPPGVSVAPTVFGMEMVILVPAVGFYTLHAWLWRHNPAGMFAHWNPNVSCS